MIVAVVAVVVSVIVSVVVSVVVPRVLPAFIRRPMDSLVPEIFVECPLAIAQISLTS